MSFHKCKDNVINGSHADFFNTAIKIIAGGLCRLKSRHSCVCAERKKYQKGGFNSVTKSAQSYRLILNVKALSQFDISLNK